MKTKKITIHKKNSVIRGTDDYSLNAKRAMNGVYWAVQRHQLFKHNKFKLKITTMREIMGLDHDNRYVERIREAFLELQRPIQLNNFEHPIDGIKYSWYSTVFLNSVGFERDDQDVIIVEVNALMLHYMALPGNFTEIDLLKYAQKFRTKHAMKLYEYLASFRGYRYLDIAHGHLMKLLNFDPKKSRQRYYSAMKDTLVRQLKEIAAKSDLAEVRLDDRSTHRKEGIFRIIIDPKSQQVAKKEKVESMIKKIINRI